MGQYDEQLKASRERRLSDNPDLGLYTKKNSDGTYSDTGRGAQVTGQAIKDYQSGAKTAPKSNLESNADSFILKFRERSPYVYFGTQQYDKEAFNLAAEAQRNWWENTGSKGKQYGYDMTDPEDVLRAQEGRYSKKYEASYGDDEYSQWLLANGQASKGFFESKYYKEAYNSVMLNRAEQERVKNFKKAVVQELVATAENSEHPTNDEIAEATLRIQRTNPMFAGIDIVNPKTSDTSYDGYFSSALAEQEAAESNAEKRSNALYLDDVYDAYYAAWDSNERRKTAVADWARSRVDNIISSAITNSGYNADMQRGTGLAYDSQGAKEYEDNYQRKKEAATAAVEQLSNYYDRAQIQAILEQDGRLSYMDSQQKIAADVAEAERKADIDMLGNQLLGLSYENEKGQKVVKVSETPTQQLIKKAQAIANMGTAARAGFSPISMDDNWQAENLLSDNEKVVLNVVMENARSQLASAGFGDFEVDEYFRRADLGEYIPPEQAMRNALIASGMDESDVQNVLDSYTDEDWANAQRVALDLAAIEGVSNSTIDQLGYSIISIPVTAAFKVASSFANFADMVARDPDWAFVDTLNEKADRWAEIGHDSNHKVLSTMSEVGSEIFRILAVSKLGAMAGGASAATNGMSWIVSQAGQRIPFIASAMGSYYGEAKAGGASSGEATKYALIAGTVEGILESLAIGDVMQSHLGSKLFSKKVVDGTGVSRQLFAKYGLPLADIIVSSVGEGLEESLSYVASGLARRGSWDNNYKMSWDELGENFMGGLLIGGIMSGLAAPANSQRYKYATEMLEKTGTYTTDFDSLYAASYFETRPQAQRDVLTEKYNNGEIVADKNTRKEAIKAERELDAISREVTAKQQALEAARVDAQTKVEQADKKVSDMEQRIATLRETDNTKKAKKIAELTRQLNSARKAQAEVHSEAEKKVKTAESDYTSILDKQTTKAADLEETIANYQAAKYFTDFYGIPQKPAQNAPAGGQVAMPITNTTDTANVAQNPIDTVKTETVEVTPEPALKDLGANTPAPVEMVQSKVYTNTYDRWLDDAEKLADDTGNSWYARSKEVDTLATAKSVVEGSIRRSGNLDSVMAQLQDKNAWDATDVDTAMLVAETLRGEAATTGDYAKLNEWKNVIRQNMTQSGQAIQALAKWTRNSSIAAENALVKAVDKINKDNKKKIASGKAQTVEINPELLNELQAAETAEQREEVVNKITADIGAKMPVGVIDKINAWRYLAMLGNPRTMFRNLVGNEIMSDVLWVGKDTIGTLLESGLDQSQRTKAVMVGDTYKANRDYAASTIKEAKNKLEGSSRYDTKKGVEKAIAESTPVFKLKNVEGARKLTNYALSKGDSVFLERQYKRSFAQIMTARGYAPDTITAAQKKECMDYAIAEAQRSTFHDASAVADTLSKLEQRNVVTKVLVGGVLPFKKTPINVLARGVDFSPIGLIQGTTQYLTKVKSGEMSAAQAVDKISSGLTGSALLALGVFLAKSGIITGANEDEDKYYMSDLGYQEFALNVGDGKSITIDWAAPATIPLFMGVALNSVLEGEAAEGENKLDALINTLSGITDPLVEMSMLQGLQDTLESAAEATKNDESAIWGITKNAAYNYVSSFVPTSGGQIARTIDPVRRDTAGDPTSELGKELDKVTNKMQAKIPGIADNLEPYINIWGEQEINEHSWPVRLLENAILPGYLDEVDMTPVDVEITRLYSTTQNPDVIPSNYPYRTLKDYKTKDSYILSNTEFTEFKTENGGAMYAAVLDAINSRSYSMMDDDEKVAFISDVIKEAQEDILTKYKKKYLNK